MNNMNKRNLIISITIIILALGVGSFYLWSQKKEDLIQTNADKQEQVVGQGEGQEQKNDKREKGQTENQEQNQKQLDTNSDIKYNPDGTIDTSDWKAYRNEEFGFELRYPKEWFCGGVALNSENKRNLFCLPEKFKDQYYAGLYHGGGVMLYFDKKKRIYNNVDKYGVKNVTVRGDKYNVQFTLFPMQNKQDKNLLIFSELIASFKFIK